MPEEDKLSKILEARHKIFSPEFSYFIDVIGTLSEQKGNFDEYMKLCEKIKNTITGEHTTEAILALTYHLVNVMSQDNNMDSINKSRDVLNRNDVSYI